MPDIKELETEMKSTFEGFKNLIERQEAEIKKTGETTGETKSALEKTQDALDRLEGELKSLQTKFNRPGLGGGAQPGGDDPQVKAFGEWLRKGDQRMGAEQLKALSTDSDTEGGYLMAQATRGQMIELLTKVSPVRALATVVTLTQGDTYEAPKETGDIDAGWTSERGARGQTGTPKVGMERIVAQEQYAAPRITQKMLDDAGYNVEQWLNGKLSKKFAQLEGRAFLLGNGVGQPEGILTKAGVGEVVSGSAAAITADSLFDLFFELDEEYAARGQFLMKRTTLRDIRKLKDNQGNYLWTPGIAGATPNMILDRPYTLCDDMPAIAANAYPVVFGDIAQAYVVVDRQGIVVQRDPFTAKPFVEFYSTRRVGGGVVLTEALKKLKISA